MNPRHHRIERDRKLQTACLLIITSILLGAVAYQMSTALIPLVLALFIFQVLDPVVVWLTLKAHLPRPLAAGLTLSLTIIAVLVTSSFLTTSVTQLITGSDTYVSQLTKVIEQVSDRFPFVGERFRHLSQGKVEQFSAEIGSFLAWLANSFVYLLSQSTIVLLFLTFLLFGSSSHKNPLPSVLDDINLKVRKYIQVKTVLSLATGVLAGAILWLLGIELALVFGLLTVILNFLPNVGPLIATLLPLPMIMLSPSVSQGEALLAILLPGTFHFLIGNLLEPRLLGDTLELSPVVVLFSLAVWTSLWGGIGALLAVPMTSIIQILCERLDFTRPIAQILKGNFLELFDPPPGPLPTVPNSPEVPEKSKNDPSSVPS